MRAIIFIYIYTPTILFIRNIVQSTKSKGYIYDRKKKRKKFVSVRDCDIPCQLRDNLYYHFETLSFAAVVHFYILRFVFGANIYYNGYINMRMYERVYNNKRVCT
jgi:hypothetical protein